MSFKQDQEEYKKDFDALNCKCPCCGTKERYVMKYEDAPQFYAGHCPRCDVNHHFDTTGKLKTNYNWKYEEKQDVCPRCQEKNVRRIMATPLYEIWVCYTCGQAQYIKKEPPTIATLMKGGFYKVDDRGQVWEIIDDCDHFEFRGIIEEEKLEQKPRKPTLVYCEQCKDFRDFTYSNNEHYNCKTCGALLGFDRQTAERVADGHSIVGDDKAFCFQWGTDEHHHPICIRPVLTREVEAKNHVGTKEQILFSNRLRMQQEFYDWCLKTKADAIPMNVLAWLQTTYDFIRKT